MPGTAVYSSRVPAVEGCATMSKQLNHFSVEVGPHLFKRPTESPAIGVGPPQEDVEAEPGGGAVHTDVL